MALLKRKKTEIVEENLITNAKHVAFIMDGNGRWAKRRGLPRSLGHREGCKRIKDITLACMDFKLDVMSIYCFSTENWKRSKSEIDYLFNLLRIFFKKEIDELDDLGVKVMTLGDLSRLPEATQKVIYKAKERTKNNKNFTLNICLNYGGKDEIVRAVKDLVTAIENKELTKEEITEEKFLSFMESHELPPVDLMVRTSGEQRISNYMLWEIAYAELVFVEEHWPDFRKENLRKVLEIYNTRDRRFGGVKDDSK